MAPPRDAQDSLNKIPIVPSANNPFSRYPFHGFKNDPSINYSEISGMGDNRRMFTGIQPHNEDAEDIESDCAATIPTSQQRSLISDMTDGGGDRKQNIPREASPPRGLNREENRLSTFATWPGNAKIEATKLAKAGFYYTGEGTRVRCFSCQGSIDDWEFNDSAIHKHQMLNRNCAFVARTSDNVPMRSAAANGYTQSIGPMGSSIVGNLSQSLRKTQSMPLSLKPQPVPSTMSSSVVRDKTWTNFSSLVSEQERLNTFKGWPSPFVRDVDLARAGFFYLKEADKVRCIFCNGVVGEWEPGDVPITEHHRHFPACPFIRGFNVGNIAIENGTTANRTTEGNSQFERMLQSPDDNWGGDVAGCYKYEMAMFTAPEKGYRTPNRWSELGINQHTAPVHANFATVESRLRTFHGWPRTIPQTADALAEAGFYYAGVSDHVRCFCCDGGLRNWEATDDPWIEHARWFGRCNFLTIVKGHDFINEARTNYPPIISKPSTSKQSPMVPHSVSEVTSRVNDQLNSQVVQRVLEIGVDVRAVRKAIIRRLRDEGTPFPDPDSLYESCLGEDVNTLEEELIGSCVEKFSPPQSSLVARSASGPSPMEVSCQTELKSENNILPKLPEHRVSGIANQTTKSTDPMSMEEENRQLKEMRLCKICLDDEVGVVFLPCGHLVCCPRCAPSLTDCPLCRKKIHGTVRTFLA